MLSLYQPNVPIVLLILLRNANLKLKGRFYLFRTVLGFCGNLNRDQIGKKKKARGDCSVVVAASEIAPDHLSLLAFMLGNPSP